MKKLLDTKRSRGGSIVIFSPLILFFLSPHVVRAVSFGIGITDYEQLWPGLLCPIASVMYWILFPVSVILIIYAAYLYFAGAGANEERIAKAHKTIAYAAVALIVAFSAQGFPRLMQSIFGASGLPPSC